MANILQTYGIKEVCDVTFYEINQDGTPGAPVLYLDSLKVSTMEQTAENTSARGGKGNPERIIWDYGKEITLNLEDCVFSPKSMAIMYGALDADGKVKIADKSDAYIIKTVDKAQVSSSGTSYTTTVRGKKISLTGAGGSGSPQFYTAAGSSATFSDCDYVTGYVKIDGSEIVISSDTFAGTYYVTGDTYARSEATGEDEAFQLVIPKAKVLSESTLTMEAEGDPSTFQMNLRVLTGNNNEMVRLLQYDFDESGVG